MTYCRVEAELNANLTPVSSFINLGLQFVHGLI